MGWVHGPTQVGWKFNDSNLLTWKSATCSRHTRDEEIKYVLELPLNHQAFTVWPINIRKSILINIQ